jgi:flagellar hook-length control protein FliK
MQDNSLGGIELRAHIAGDQIGASIAVEHHDAQVMLTSELPALHTALNEKNLRVNIQSVSQGSMTSMNGGLGGESGYKGFSQTPRKSPYAAQEETPMGFQDVQAEPANRGSSNSGLSVRA